MNHHTGNHVTNAKFKDDFFGDSTAWGTSFIEYPTENGGGCWGGSALKSTVSQEFENVNANNFISVSSFVDPAKGRKKDNVNALHMVMLDDVGTKVPEEKITLPPSCKIETSPGNYQVIFKLDLPCADRDVAQALLDDIKAAGLSDPDGNSLVRYVRCPTGTNTKPDYEKPFKHRVSVYQPKKTYSIEQIREGLGISEAPKKPKVGDTFKSYAKSSLHKNIDKSRLEIALSLIDPDPYDSWTKVGMGLHHEYGGSSEGLDRWKEWSSQSSKYKQEEMAYKWSSFDESTLPQGDNPITGGTILAIARKTLTYDKLAMEIEKTCDTNKLITFVADMITEAELKESQKNLLRKTIANKTGTSIQALNKDAKLKAQEIEQETQIDIARQVLESYGHGNLIYTEGRLYGWCGKGVWENLDRNSLKKIIHGIAPEHKLSANFTNSVTTLIETEVFQPDIAFDGNPVGINCPNGELHLDGDSWTLRPHERDTYSLSQIPVPYDPSATAPRFQQFLNEIFAGDDDADQKAQLLLELIGYSLMPSCEFEKFVILIGNGANGKSVALALISMLAGEDNVAAVPPERLGNTHQRAYLRGKLVNLVTEIPEGSLIDDASLKALVSGDLMTADEKYKAPVNFNPYATCWFGTNHMPSTRDFSDALFRRACILTFNNRFEGANCDPLLKKKLEQEAPGILNMALAAISSAIKKGALTEPPSMVQALDTWRLEADQVRQFVRECCELDKGEELKSDVWEGYKQFAQDYGIPTGRQLSRVKFNKRLMQLGIGERRDGEARYYTGVRLKNPPWEVDIPPSHVFAANL